MKVVLSGPFGYGTLADEVVLAGLLLHLKQHQVTVLCGDAKRVAAIHAVNALELPAPRGLEMAPKAWAAVAGAHLFILASGGVLSDKGKPPARLWLAQAELARRARIKTAVIGVGAVSINDARERLRLQRVLHNFTDGISTRDDESKDVLISYGMNANAVSSNGDPGLALATAKTSNAPQSKKVGIVLAESVPSRHSFGIEAQRQSVLQRSLSQLLALLQSQADQLLLLHDDTDSAHKLAQTLRAQAKTQVTLLPANRPILELQRELATCSSVFSVSLHGLILAATAHIPCVGLSGEHSAATFLGSLGLSNMVVPTGAEGFDAETAATLMVKAAEGARSITDQLRQSVPVLARKEAQNSRIIEYLVPRRDRYPARGPKPKRAAKPQARED